MTVAPPKVNIWVFVKIRVLGSNDVTTSLGGVTPDILSRRYMLYTFRDHNPSRSELYNNGPLNVEKLLCGQFDSGCSFYVVIGKLTISSLYFALM